MLSILKLALGWLTGGTLDRILASGGGLMATTANCALSGYWKWSREKRHICLQESAELLAPSVGGLPEHSFS